MFTITVIVNPEHVCPVVLLIQPVILLTRHLSLHCTIVVTGPSTDGQNGYVTDRDGIVI